MMIIIQQIITLICHLGGCKLKNTLFLLSMSAAPLNTSRSLLLKEEYLKLDSFSVSEVLKANSISR